MALIIYWVARWDLTMHFCKYSVSRLFLYCFVDGNFKLKRNLFVNFLTTLTNEIEIGVRRVFQIIVPSIKGNIFSKTFICICSFTIILKPQELRNSKYQWKFTCNTEMINIVLSKNVPKLLPFLFNK